MPCCPARGLTIKPGGFNPRCPPFQITEKGCQQPPCYHQFCRSDIINRNCLSRCEHTDLLATPKGYCWELGRPMKGNCRCKSYQARNRCDAKMFPNQCMTEVWNLLTPEMIEKLKDMLIEEFGMTEEEAELFINQQRYKSGKKGRCCCPKRKCGVGPRFQWAKDLGNVLANKFTDYIVKMLCVRRTKKTKCIAEHILKQLCDITGEECTLTTPSTRIQRVMVFAADRLAIWMAHLCCICDDKKICKSGGPKPCDGGKKKDGDGDGRKKRDDKPKPKEPKKIEEKKAEPPKKIAEPPKKIAEPPKKIAEPPKKIAEPPKKVAEKKSEPPKKEPEQVKKAPPKKEPEPVKKEPTPKKEPEKPKVVEKPPEPAKKEPEPPKKEPEPPKKEPEPPKKEPEPPKKEPEPPKKEPEPPKQEPEKTDSKKSCVSTESKPCHSRSKTGSTGSGGDGKLSHRKSTLGKTVSFADDGGKGSGGSGGASSGKRSDSGGRRDGGSGSGKTGSGGDGTKDGSGSGKTGQSSGGIVDHGSLHSLRKEVMEHVSDWVEETVPEKTERQSFLQEVISNKLKSELELDDGELCGLDEAIDDVSCKLSTWLDQMLDEAEGDGRPCRKGVTYHIKRCDGSFYDVKRIDSDEVCETTTAARLENAYLNRPRNLNTCTQREKLEWAKWAAGVVKMAEKWANWIDTTCAEMSKRRQGGSCPMNREAYCRWKLETEARAREFRTRKAELKEVAKLWNEKATKCTKQS